jgi:C-terminal processing protease CtpA/Prc
LKEDTKISSTASLPEAVNAEGVISKDLRVRLGLRTEDDVVLEYINEVINDVIDHHVEVMDKDEEDDDDTEGEGEAEGEGGTIVLSIT